MTDLVVGSWTDDQRHLWLLSYPDGLWGAGFIIDTLYPQESALQFAVFLVTDFFNHSVK